MTDQTANARTESMRRYGFGYDAMKQIKVCAQCGAASPLSLQFCRACGGRLPAESLYEAHKKSHRCCPSCETLVSPSAQFCPQCGAKLTQTE